MSVFLRGTHWHFAFSLDGRRYRRRCGKSIKTETAARRVEDRARAKAMAGELGTGRRAPRLSDFAPVFEEFITATNSAGNLTDNGLKNWLNGLRLLKATPAWDKPIDAMGKSFASTLCFPLKRKSTSGDASANVALRTLHRILTYAYELGLLMKAPAKFKLREDHQRDQVIEPWLEGLILKHARQPLRDAIILGIDGALRASEVCALKWEDVHLDTMRPHIFIAKSKTRKGRRPVGITSRMRAVLEKRKANGSTWVFPSTGSKSGRPAKCGHLLPSSLDKMWRMMKGRVIAEITECSLPPWPEGLVFHSCRHTAATRYSEVVGNPFKIADFVGHADTRTTRRYVHHEDDSAAAMERYKEKRLSSVGGTNALLESDRVLEDLSKLREEELAKLVALASDGAAAEVILSRLHSLEMAIAGHQRRCNRTRILFPFGT